MGVWEDREDGPVFHPTQSASEPTQSAYGCGCDPGLRRAHKNIGYQCRAYPDCTYGKRDAHMLGLLKAVTDSTPTIDWEKACAPHGGVQAVVTAGMEAAEFFGVRPATQTYGTMLATERKTYPPRKGHPKFYALIEEITALHDKKNADYASDTDPLSNFRKAEKFGIPAWKGVLVRMADKWSRLEELTNGKTPQNESLRDTLIDLAAYALIDIILLEEAE